MGNKSTKTKSNKQSTGRKKKMNEVIIDGISYYKSTEVNNIYFNTVNDIFSNFDFPCIYLLGIGKYKEYNNVYKFGRTDNFIRRYKEHNKSYNTLVMICILQYIDPDYLPKAEVDVKNYMNGINSIIQTEGHDELVSLNDKQLKAMTGVYKEIGKKYSTKTDVLQEQITNMNYKIELLTKDHELELIKEKNNNELLKKDIQLLKLENELLKTKINL